MKGRRRTLKGGMAKIGKGSRAFIVDPAIPCNDMKDTSAYVSKVFFDEEEFFDVTDKPEVFKALKEADPTQETLLYPILCEDFGELTDENMKDDVDEDNMFHSYLVKRGRGKATLNDYIKKNNPGKAKEDIVNFLVGPLRTVFEAIALLHSKDLIHHDLHLWNILMNDGKAQIIDFDATGFGYVDKDQLRKQKTEEVNQVIEDIVQICKNKYNLYNDPDLKFIIEEFHKKFPTVGGRRRRRTVRRRQSRRKSSKSRR